MITGQEPEGSRWRGTHSGIWITQIPEVAEGARFCRPGVGGFAADASSHEPPEGIRLAVKDLFDTAGVTTTYGSTIFAEHVPVRTAEAVTRLEQAGFVTVGKANLHEFAYGTTSLNPHFGWVPNPLAPGRIAGGSSGGSAAALAAGLADAGLGTDSGGSIRIPAAFCGVVGFKPTYGLVSLAGCWPLAPSYDHAGPMALSTGECAAMMGPLAGLEAEPVDLEAVRVAVARSWLDECDPLVCARVDVVAALFPNREDVVFPAEAGDYDVFAYDVARVHETLFVEHRDEYGDEVARKIERCLNVGEAEARDAAVRREAYRARCAELLDGFDLLLTPTQPFVAPRIEDAAGDALRERIIRFTYPFDALGWPALAVPCGPAEEGLPASLQLAAPQGADALVLGVGMALEHALTVSS